MKVTVVIASYNHRPYVEEAVRSVLSQDGVEVELRVLDDGSTDGSPELLTQLREELGFKLSLRENRGFVPTMRELTEGLETKYFCSLGSDDRMAPGRLRTQVELLETHPEAPACAGQARSMDGEGKLASRLMRQYLAGYPKVSFEQLFLAKRSIHACTVLVRTDAFRKVGGYDSRFRFEDLPLWLALTRSGAVILVSNQEACHYRVHGANMHTRVDFIFGQILDILAAHSNHPLYARARNEWTAGWWSHLADRDRSEALRRIPELGSFSWPFLHRLPKLLLPHRRMDD